MLLKLKKDQEAVQEVVIRTHSKELLELIEMIESLPDFGEYESKTKQSSKCIEFLSSFKLKIVRDHGRLQVRKLVQEGYLIVQRDHDDQIIPKEKVTDDEK